MKSNKKLIGKGMLLAAAAAAIVPAASAAAIDLTGQGVDTLDVPAVFGGTGVVTDLNGTEGRGVYQPTGTGVFKPFLSLDSNGQQSTGNTAVEQAFNTDHAPLYLDEHRQQWNTLVRLSDLAQVTVAGKSGTFFAFVLDSNEPGNNNKKNISIDNVRIYTGADNTAAVGSDPTKINQLGALRWAMNNTAVDGNNNLINLGPGSPAAIANYILLDSTQENLLSNSNGGSGKGDMILFVPTSAFAGADFANDFLWFYNLNGRVQNAGADSNGDGAAQAGFEEWKYLAGATSVPDGGATAILLGLGALGLAVARKRA